MTKLVRHSLGLGAALLAITSLPYIYAFRSASPDLVYTGLMYDVPDHAQYWSWVAASRHSFFISNTMTPEANPAIFANAMMWVLARVQSAFDLSFPALFQWWRAAAVFMLVPALLAFVRIMVPERQRATALVLALVGAGLGWTLVAAKWILRTSDVPWPQDLYTVEPNTFWALLSYPNILIAQALVLTTMLASWVAYRDGTRWAFVLAAAGACALSLSHAYDLITVYAVLALFGGLEWLRLRRLPSRLVGLGAVVTLFSAPVALYYQHLTSTDPLWRSILSQYPNAGVWTPRYGHLVILMGIPLGLAVWGIVRCREWSRERRFLVLWAATSLGLIYLPVVYQIKLLSGWQFPLAALAAYAWHEWVVPAGAGRRTVIVATVVLAIGSGLTNAYLFAWRLVELRRHSAPYYLQRDSVEALSWLSQHATPADVVLAPIEVGQFVPSYGGSRAYLAHWAMTNRFFERRENVERFFRQDTPEAWREQLLAAEGVTLVLRAEPRVAADSLVDPGRWPSFEPLFRRPHAQVYRFRPGGRLAQTGGAPTP